jgi:IMP dehydrogenase/GMP reductase
MITDPVTCRPGVTVAEVETLCATYRDSGVPVTDDEGILLAIVTNPDIRFETDHSRRVTEVMTPMPLVTAPPAPQRRRRWPCSNGTKWRSRRWSTRSAARPMVEGPLFDSV